MALGKAISGKPGPIVAESRRTLPQSGYGRVGDKEGVKLRMPFREKLAQSAASPDSVQWNAGSDGLP